MRPCRGPPWESRPIPHDRTSPAQAAVAWRREGVLALAALLIFLLAGAWLLRGALFGGQVLSASAHLVRTGPFAPEISARAPPDIPSLSDSRLQFVPWLRFAADAWAADGRLPLWKDTAGTGAPFVGNGQSAALFPINLLIMLAGAPPVALALQALAKLVGGALAAFLLGRHLGLSFAAALLCGLVFGFGGFQMGWFLHPHTNVSLLLPLLVLAADRLVLRPTLPALALLAAVAGLQHLGGHPETAFHAQVAVALLGGARLLGLRSQASVAERLRRFAWLLGGLVLGLALGAAQVLPLLEYLQHSAALDYRSERSPLRALEQPWAAAGFVVALGVALFAARRLVRPGRTAGPVLLLGGATFAGVLLGLKSGLSPTFVLGVTPDWFGTAQRYFGPGARIEGTGAFVGAAWPLAALGLLGGRARGSVRAAGVLVAVGLLAGASAPVVSDVLAVLPVFRLAVNTRLVLLALLGLAVLAGFGLDGCRSLREAGARRRLAALLGAPLLAAFAALVAAVQLGDVSSTNGPARPARSSLTTAGLVTASEVAGLLGEPATAAEPVRTVSGYVVSRARPASIRVLYGKENDSVAARFVAAPASAPSTWVFQAGIPEARLLPERAIVRVLVADAEGGLAASGWLTSPDDPGPRLPFPARPAPGGTPRQLVLLLLALALLLVPAREGALAWRRGALLLVVVLGLVPFASGMVPLLPRDLFHPASPVIDALRDARPDGRAACLVPSLFGAEIPTYYGVADVRSYDALGPRHATALAGTALGRAPRVSVERPTEIDPSADEPDLTLLGLMAVERLLAVGTPPPGLRELDVPGRPTDSPWHVLENPAFLPRARLVGGAVIEPDDERALALLRAPDFPRDRGLVLPAGSPAPPAGDLGPARIVLDRPDVVRVEIEASAPGFLLLADSFFPGWTATVDGAPREILRANVAFRAVRVAPGERAVEFRYAPGSFRTGLGVTLAAAVLMLGACGAAAWRRRRRSA